jgi:hypothetical protein
MKSSRIVDDHGFFMYDVEGRVRVQDLDIGVHQRLALLRSLPRHCAERDSMIRTFTPRE